MSIVSFNWVVMGCQTKGSTLLATLSRQRWFSKEQREEGDWKAIGSGGQMVLSSLFWLCCELLKIARKQICLVKPMDPIYQNWRLINRILRSYLII